MAALEEDLLEVVPMERSTGASLASVPMIRRRRSMRLRLLGRPRSSSDLPAGSDAAGPRCWSAGNFCRECGFWIFFACLCMASVTHLIYLKLQHPSKFKQAWQIESIPIVGVLFTWGHIWLAVQMMFYPVKFKGIWNYKNTGNGIGWQGVVPRKAGVMAEKSVDLMLGRLISMEEIIDKFEMDAFFETLGTVLLDCQRIVNEKLGAAYFPRLWANVPQSVKDEILSQTTDTQRESFRPILLEIRSNIKNILDIKDMTVQRYTNEPTLLVDLFRKVGSKEFLFIQRIGAQMGLLCGLIQMGLFFVTHQYDWARWVILPVSGLLIGNFTNWLAIQMIFRPVNPHFFCCGRCNFQGLFLKRQKQVSKELAKLLTETCVNAEHMISYLVSSPGYMEALDIFRNHTIKACDQVLGSFSRVMPMALGSDQWTGLKEDVVKSMMDELPNHSSAFLEYIDKVLEIEETIATRLALLPPEQFEGMLHPAFQEDEWLLILAGGSLGVVVGFFQAWVLGS